MKDNIILSENAKKHILKIEKTFKTIQDNENTLNALDFLQEIKDYLVKTYCII